MPNTWWPGGSYDARQAALQQHLFGANFTKVAPFAAPAAVSVATALYAHNAAHNPKDAQESRINLKACCRYFKLPMRDPLNLII